MWDAEKKGCLVAVDGGGTKTEICALDLASRTVKSVTFGSANYKSSDKATAAASISEGFAKALADMEVSLSSVRGAVFGIAGCDTEEDMRFYRSTVSALGLDNTRAYICNDSEMALLAEVDEGICVVAGTGSIATGVTADGRKKRAGGWGAPASDEGSGWWMGNEMLRSYLRWADGMGEHDAYFDTLTALLGAGERAAAVESMAAMGAAATASLARGIMDAAREGDALCAAIKEAAAGHIADITACVWSALGFDTAERVSVAALGSLFNDEQFLSAVARRLREEHGAGNIELIKVDGSPARCGLKLAEKLFLMR